jgi:hypothetical protein
MRITEEECLRRPKGSALWNPTWGKFDLTVRVAKSVNERDAMDVCHTFFLFSEASCLGVFFGAVL